MNSEIFTERKKFSEEFFKNRVNFIITNNQNLLNKQMRYVYGVYPLTIFTTNMFTPDKYNLDFVEEKIKAYLLYIISMLESGKMFNNDINKIFTWCAIAIRFCDSDIISRENASIIHIFKGLLDEQNVSFFTFLNQNIEALKNRFTYESPRKPFHIEFCVDFKRIFNNHDIIMLNDEGEIVFTNFEGQTTINNNDEGQTVISEDEEETVINTSQIFKSEECVICLSTKPNILFCNCGHLCLCKECNEIKNLKKCPICKTENTILRIVE